jgi:DNA-binding CsgD family transcriptional regulator
MRWFGGRRRARCSGWSTSLKPCASYAAAISRPAVEIAKLLNLSGKTVANYHTLIKQKLRLSSDVELVLLAQRQNVIM